MWLRQLAAAAASVALTLGVAGCGLSGSAGAANTSTSTVQIVAAFYPLQFVAERVAGVHASVQPLTSPGAEPHDLELTPKQVAAVGNADLIVYQHGFQPAVDAAVAQSDGPARVDAAQVVPLQPLPEPAGAADEPADHAAEHGAADPHLWLDPTQLIPIARAVQAELARVDQAHAADYAANTEALARELIGLDAAFRTGLADCRRSTFVTTHAAFGYLARRYGLTQIPVSGVNPEVEPSPARVAAVQRLARQHQVTTIFSETLISPATAEAIAGDLGLRTDVLDPVEGITAESAGSDYFSVMRANLSALREANACR